jgi:hypothetical protein
LTGPGCDAAFDSRGDVEDACTRIAKFAQDGGATAQGVQTGGDAMRQGLWVAVPLLVAACSSDAPSSGSSRLTLNNPFWDRVNVEVIFTKRGDCNQGDGFINSRQVVMRKNKTESFDVPEGASVCWRHDRNPNNPKSGDWTDWSRATLFPGQSTSTDL